MMRATILDYGSGNLHSLAKALSGAGRSVRIEGDPLAALDTDVLVLPGVGAFGHAVRQLAPARDALGEAILRGLPTLGICLGMQLLFDASDEGEGGGLGVFRGRVTRLRSARTPHMGWNTIDDATDPLYDTSGLRTAYYANSFACRAGHTASDARANASITAWSTHEQDRFPASVRHGSVMGVQFHPEKSGAPGLRYIDHYLRSIVDHAPTAPLDVRSPPVRRSICKKTPSSSTVTP